MKLSITKLNILLIVFCLVIIACFLPGNQSMKKVTFISWDRNQSAGTLEHHAIKLLKEKLALRGYLLDTLHAHPMRRSDLIINASRHYKMPKGIKAKTFYWALESPISLPMPLPAEEEKKYAKIFTHNPDVTYKEKYVHLPIPYHFKPEEFKIYKQKKILLAQVASLYYKSFPNNYYYKRSEDTLWMLKNHPNDFILAGKYGWNTFGKKLSPDIKVIFNQIYRGAIKDKIEFLRPVKFALAYENGKSNGYVSEKIFDVMAAGTVPIYFGAPDIETYVPKACFINRDDFKTMDELYYKLKNMPDEEYNGYIKCITNFIKNGSQQKNSRENVIDTMITEILKK